MQLNPISYLDYTVYLDLLFQSTISIIYNIL